MRPLFVVSVVELAGVIWRGFLVAALLALFAYVLFGVLAAILVGFVTVLIGWAFAHVIGGGSRGTS